MHTILTSSDLQSFDRIQRLTLINALSGVRGANLIGTATPAGHPNLAIFNSVMHVGSDPALMGFLLRPLTVARHTYANIRATEHFTVNHVQEPFLVQAHHTSANFEAEISEFEATGLTPEWADGMPAPYVLECAVKIGLRWVEEHVIQANGTVLVVGEILEVRLPHTLLAPDGFLDLEKAGSLGVGGLDAYYRLEKVGRLGYARPQETPSWLNDR